MVSSRPDFWHNRETLQSVDPPCNHSQNEGPLRGGDYTWPFSGSSQPNMTGTAPQSRREGFDDYQSSYRSMPGPVPYRWDRVNDGTEPWLSTQDNAPATQRAVDVESALHNLYSAFCSALAVYQSYVQYFDSQMGPAAGWAKESTLNELWRDMIKYKFRDEAEAKKFRCTGTTIRLRLRALNKAVGGPDPAMYRPEGTNVDSLMRAARKALWHGYEIVELVRQAMFERMPCKLLVDELVEAVAMLDPKTHPRLYSDGGERRDNDLATPMKTAAPMNDGNKPSSNDGPFADLGPDDSGNDEWGNGD